MVRRPNLKGVEHEDARNIHVRAAGLVLESLGVAEADTLMVRSRPGEQTVEKELV